MQPASALAKELILHTHCAVCYLRSAHVLRGTDRSTAIILTAGVLIRSDDFIAPHLLSSY